MRAIGLEYHDVVAGDDFDASGFPGAAAASYKLTVPSFNAHLRAIAATGVRVARADAMPPATAGTMPVLLTFDDGGSSALSGTSGCLARFGWAGHFLVTTSRIGTHGFLDAAQIRAVHAAGHVIGSHSCTHPLRFSALGRPAMLREWADSRDALEQILGAPVTVASVPGGYFRRIAAETAADAGLRTLFTSEPVSSVRTVAGCTVLGRCSIRRATTPEEAAALAAGQLGPRARQWVVWNAKKAMKAAGGRVYLSAREWLFERGATERPEEAAESEVKDQRSPLA
ncbi:MAG TPA: polysaccharide deacetylase family protein [Gemmatimonadaceae bacterium]|nr:polysaccharide deacetylase family protein [Gemmatimonadaceae bacterium]